MYINSLSLTWYFVLSLTWYFVRAESKILRQSKLQMLVNLRRSVRIQVLVHARGEMSACFAKVTSITPCTRKFVHNAHTEPVRLGRGSFTLNEFLILKVE